jgi:hypothetical protein
MLAMIRPPSQPCGDIICFRDTQIFRLHKYHLLTLSSHTTTALPRFLTCIISSWLWNCVEREERLPSIGFLGLGTMGTAMARNLLKAGYDELT